MEIRYKDKTIQKQCEDYKYAKRKFGDKVAERLHSTINLITFATDLQDIANMQSLHFHPLQGRNKEDCKYSIYLGKKLGFRLIVIPLDDNNNKVIDDGAGNLFNSTKVLLLMEVNNHYE